MFDSSFTTYGRLLLKYLRPVWPGLLLLALFLVANVGLQLLNPWIARSFIDGAQAGVPVDALTATAIEFLVVALLIQAVSVAEGYVAENVGWLATNALRADLTEHCLELDLGFHQTHQPGELIERVDGDVSALSNFFASFVVQIVGNGVLLVGILVLLFRVDWQLGLLLTAVSVVAGGLMTATSGIGTRFVGPVRGASAEVFAALEEQLGGLPDIQGNGARAYILERWQSLLRNLVKRATRSSLIGGAVNSPGLLVLGIGSIAVFGTAALRNQAGILSVGTVFLAFQYTAMLQAPLNRLTRQVRDLRIAGASIERITWLTSNPRTIVDGRGIELPAGPLAVEFHDVSFGYDETSRALREVAFRLPEGRVLGVVGRTGSGKSTLMRLVARLYEPTEGEIRLGEVGLRDASVASLRRHVGVVTQDVQLFSASVRDNLTLFDPTLDDARIQSALDDLGLGDWLSALPGGLDAEVASNRVSAGEAQLLALTRVFLQDPGLVVLDEASSRLDLATEQLIESAVQRLFVGRTAIVIAHRLETLRHVDDILVLDNGRIVEFDRRDRLVADQSSRFAQLLRAGGAEALV
ncbi:MAG TPA: ABC transporter ATP-binding protein [Chloroflexota bacterium]|nr:ABC transporter ATP-binding protein [Chloroflexota bacterium]